MFDDILRGLWNIPERQEISVSVVLDDDGYYDRTCPAPECGSQFKVLLQDWREKVPQLGGLVDNARSCRHRDERGSPRRVD